VTEGVVDWVVQARWLGLESVGWRKVLDSLAALRVLVVGIVTDNASGMTRGLEKLVDGESGSDSDDDPEEVAQIIEEWSGTWPLPIRCWAHSFQLCTKDVAKHAVVKAGFEGVKRIVSALTRQRKAELSELEGRPCFIFQPCVTRWNSYIRTMLNVLKHRQGLAVVLGDEKPTALELHGMSIAVIVLGPLAWATDFVQQDSCTIVQASGLFEKLEVRFKWLAGLQFETVSLKNDVESAAKFVLGVVQKRFEKNFDNIFLQILAFLDGRSTHIASELQVSPATVQQSVREYFTARGTVTDENALNKEFVEFRLRTEEEKKLSPDAYWKQNAGRKPMMYMFRDAMRTVVVTEASVERSFALQKRVFAPQRCRMSDETMNMMMFLKSLLSRTKPKANPKPKLTTTISGDDWESFAVNLSAPSLQVKNQTRLQSKLQAASNLKIGARVKVLWKNPEKYYIGTVVEVHGAAKYSVHYAGEKKVRDFQPLGEDNDWDLYDEGETAQP